MIDTIYIFYNGAELDNLPEKDMWSNYESPDTVKLAWFCAESWRRNGWKVRWLNSRHAKNHFEFVGRLSNTPYPLQYFDMWYRAEELANHLSGMMIGTIDVFNYGFSPQSFARIEDYMVKDCVSFQAQHFSASLFYARAPWFSKVINLLRDYDSCLTFPTIPIDVVSDESVIRYYGIYELCPLQYYAVEPEAKTARLVHYPRSCISRFKEIC